MNVKNDFKQALIDLEFESSDEKLILWKRLEQDSEVMQLIKLAMEFSYEQGVMESDQ